MRFGRRLYDAPCSTHRKSPTSRLPISNATAAYTCPGGFNAEDAARIDGWTQEVAALPEKLGRHWVFHETSLKDETTDLINRIENISPFYEGFKALTRTLKAPVARLLGEDAVLFKEKINFKIAGGGGFKPHQDSQAGWEDYAGNFISVMVCIDEAGKEYVYKI